MRPEPGRAVLIVIPDRTRTEKPRRRQNVKRRLDMLPSFDQGASGRRASEKIACYGMLLGIKGKGKKDGKILELSVSLALTGSFPFQGVTPGLPCFLRL